VDLDDSTASSYPAELSGGYAESAWPWPGPIAPNPEIIFFDEPTTGLDPIVSGTINKLIIDSVRRIGASALTITHDISSLRQIADRVGLLYEGQLIWTGTVKQMDASKDPYVVQFINGLPHGPFTTP
jgi:phospholipid/cholesterol/gamma-HCH transport system ATP-binding protein